MPRTSSASSSSSSPLPRKWLMDRINGTSKYGERDRPDCPCCWVPPPVGWCPTLLETNFFCQCWGWIGCCESERSRCCFLHLGFYCNLIGCILTIYACLAIAEDFSLLSTTAYGHVRLLSDEIYGKFGDQEITMDIGLRAVALDNPITGVGQVVVRFDQFCDLSHDGLERYLDPADCDACNSVSSNMVISVILSAITFLPSFFTDILRMYSGYDVNCQKCFATIFAFFTVLLSLNTIFSYVYVCAAKFYDGFIPFDSEGNALPPGTPATEVDFWIEFQWSWGYGLIVLVIGTVLKFLDIFLHFCIPTPTVTRNPKEQRIYEKIKDEDF